MKSCVALSLRRASAGVVCCILSSVIHAQTPGFVLVNHAPDISGNGSVNGSVEEMLAEPATLSGSAALQDLLVPGAPTVVVHGNPTYGGTIDGTGTATTLDYSVTLSGNVTVRHVVRHSDAFSLDVVAPPPTPTGTRNVLITSSTQSLGDPTTLRNLTLSGNAGHVTLVGGTYGDITVSAGSVLVLGTTGATQPTQYNLQSLTVNGGGTIQVVGPCILTIASAAAVDGTLGDAAHPVWLALWLAGGDLTVTGSSSVSAYVRAPRNAVTISGGSSVTGGIMSDRLSISGHAKVTAIDLPPSVTVASPLGGALTIAQGQAVALGVQAGDYDGTVTRVEFYRGTTLLGTVGAPTGTPPLYAWTDVTALQPGGYSYSIRAYDNAGAYTASAPIAVTVLPTLPYSADFETGQGYSLGSLNAQLGWKTPQGAGLVTDQAFFSGAQSVVIPAGSPPGQVLQTFAPSNTQTLVYADFYSRPSVGADAGSSTTFNLTSSQFGFVQASPSSGLLRGFDGDGTGGGQWHPTKFTTALTPDFQTQSWIRLTARIDFTRKLWDLYANGNMVAADLKFLDSTASYFGTFSATGTAVSDTHVDFLYAGADNPLFADANKDGIDDVWEAKYGLDLSINDRYLTPAGNGVPVITAYINGTDPNDYYQGVPPVLTSLLVSNGQIGADGAVSIKVSDSNGNALVNAPIVFNVTTGSVTFSATASGTGGTPLVVRTDAQGLATVYVRFTSGSTATISATPQTTATVTPLSINIRSPAPDPYNGQTPLVSASSGDGQEVLAGARTAGPLVLTVTDANGQPLNNVPVSFTTDDGGAWLFLTADSSVAPNSTFTLNTNVYGEIPDIGAIGTAAVGSVQHVHVTAGTAHLDFTVKVVATPTLPPPLDVTATENPDGTVTFAWYGKPLGIDGINLQYQDANGNWQTLKQLTVDSWPLPDPTTQRYSVTLTKP